MTTLQQHISLFVHNVLDRYPGSWMVWCDPRGDWGLLLQRVAELDGSQGFTLVSITEQTAGEVGSPGSRRALQERIDAKASFVLHVTTTADRLGWLWAQALLSECIYDRSLREQLLAWGWRPQSVKTGDDEVAVLARQYLRQDPAEWGGGGGISTTATFKAAPAQVTVGNSTISGNSATYGGGILSSKSALTIVNSTISGNLAADSGGGVASAGTSFLTIVNSTVSGNSAGSGGGIYNAGGAQIANSTFSGNSAPSGGGIYNSIGQSGPRLEIGDTILNAGASGENIFNNSGTITSDGYNVCSDNGGGFLNGPGDQINTDPLLGPLQDNGGPTLTHAPLPGSPAIDAGDPNFTPPPYYDQRGPCYRRVYGRRIDVGSVEVQPPRCLTPAPRPTPH